MVEMLPPQIIALGGKDLDGTWGAGKTFVREEAFELINLPVPLFMLSPFVPAINSFHPLYPFVIAKDSRISNVRETQTGRTLTVSTTYQILKHHTPLNGLSGWDLDAVIAGNLPHLLPAQDVEYDIVPVEETLTELYVEKTESEINRDTIQTGLINSNVERYKTIPFETTSGTKLTGTKTRNIVKMSFWYFVEVTPEFDEAALLTNFIGSVNDSDMHIAGRWCPAGTAKIESISFPDGTWERYDIQVKMIKIILLLDYRTWEKSYENVSNLFMAFPYEFKDSDWGKKNIKMVIEEESQQPKYFVSESFVTDYWNFKTGLRYDITSTIPINASSQRIFCIMYDDNPVNIGSTDEPIYVSDPQNAKQFFGTREDCFRLNPDSEPTEVPEPMYLDENGFIIYPNPDTGKVDISLSPKIKGYNFPPKNFSLLHIPVT